MKAVPDPPPATNALSSALFSMATLRRMAVVVGLAVLLAAALNPIFVTPFSILLARLVAIALLLLLVFTLAGLWQLPGVPRWVAQVVALLLAAPLATILVYLPSVGGDLWALVQHEGLVQGLFLVSSAALVVAPLLAMGALYRERDAQARNERLRFELERSGLEKQALDARLRLLHAQIEPHFLFNTLANVQELVESGSPLAPRVLKSLIAYLRAAMPRLDDVGATLGSEAQLVQAYLELMHMRMPDRLRFSIDIPAELAGQRFPAMALLTLVENAIHHGIDPSEQGGSIVVRARRYVDSGSVTVSVIDSGMGMSETAVPGTGLANLRERLSAFYGAGVRLDMLEERPHGVRADISFMPAGETPDARLASR